MGLISFLRKKTRRRTGRRGLRRVRVEAGNWYRWRIKVVGVPSDRAARKLLENGYGGTRVHDLRVIRVGDPLLFEYTSYQLGDAEITLGAQRDVSGPSVPAARESVVAVHLTLRPR